MRSGLSFCTHRQGEIASRDSPFCAWVYRYAKLTLHGQTHKSKTIKRSLNPDWEQTLEFRGNLGEFLTLNLELSVRDHDEITRDDDLGSLVLPLRHHYRGAQSLSCPN